MKVAVVGASGFVGSEVFRTFREAGGFEVVPFARSSGNSWDLLRRGIAPVRLNLKDAEATTAAMAGFDIIVNASRPGQEQMLPSVRHLLAAARAGGAKRFVHISSVAIYGDPPPAEAETEAATPVPTNSYGRQKLAQDELVAAAARGGLSAITVCPPNIGGPASGFVSDVLDELRTGQLPLVDGGARALAMVDVGNLAHAILCAATRGPTDGRRLFVTDAERVTWGMLVAALAPLTTEAPVPRAIDAQLLGRMRDRNAERQPSFKQAAMRVVSGGVRRELSAEPWWDELLQRSKKAVLGLPEFVREPLRARLSAPASAPRRSEYDGIRVSLVSQQLRGVLHSSAAAAREIGYVPRYSFADSMAGFARWHRAMHPPGHFEGHADFEEEAL